MKTKNKSSAQTVIEDVLQVKKKETVLIIANPSTNPIAQELFTAALEAGAKPTLMFQTTKTSFDYAEETVVGALKSNPDVVLSISENKLGKDENAIKNPYKTEDGRTFNSTFDYYLDGTKTMRGVWTPGLTEDMFERTVNIDYKVLAKRCEDICKKYENAVSVRVTAPGGTDVLVPVKGRLGLVDNGDFSKPGTGGNVPAGEVFISPVVGTGNKGLSLKTLKDRADKALKSLLKIQTKDSAEQNSSSETAAEKGTEGVIVFDGSMTFSGGDSILNTPITVTVKEGFVSEVKGGEEAKRLLKDISWAETEPFVMEASGKLPKGQAAVYARNARNIGELGIGLNPAANITGNMLEDEKAFRTCHFAIGENYDGDAPSLIHFDGVVRDPTIVINYEDGSQFTLLSGGDLQI